MSLAPSCIPENVLSLCGFLLWDAVFINGTVGECSSQGLSRWDVKGGSGTGARVSEGKNEKKRKKNGGNGKNGGKERKMENNIKRDAF